MRKNSCYFIVCALCVCMLSACGSSKNAVVSQQAVNPYGTSIARDECEILAEEKPEVRQFGVGSHFKRATADNIAALQARAKFARAIESAVLTATEEYGVSMEKFAGDDVVGNTAIDQAATSRDIAMTIAQTVVKNTSVIKTTVYYKENKQFNVFVCVEYLDGIDKMAETVVGKIEDAISADDKARIKASRDEFVENIKSGIVKGMQEQ